MAAELPYADIRAEIEKYTDFVENHLRVDLRAVLAERESILEQSIEYGKLSTQIQTIKDAGLTEMKTQVDLGSNFYVQAKVPDTQFIYVNVGFGFHLELTLDEALAFLERKTSHLQEKANKCTRKASEIKAHIQIIMGTLEELMAM
ncbi:Prefoldin subunit-domain-containing protein [Blastocladiella britannica]|nr:Prefoldin subunit-domain-containing protein [Blastocladiella britannica]